MDLAGLARLKREGKKIVGVVCWDTPMAQIADRAGVDLVSVGDSVGGAKYRIKAHERFAQRLAFVRASGLQAVADLKDAKPFNADPTGGPWGSVLRHDKSFAASFVTTTDYEKIVEQMCRNLFDRDTSPGAEPEALLKLDIPALVIPGRDESHTTSAARYLEECLAKSQYWDVPPEGQNEVTAPRRLLEFLEAFSS